VILQTIDLPGGYNNNGVVDFADYILWRDDLGQRATIPNDTTPGTVTQADYDVSRAHLANPSAVAPVLLRMPLFPNRQLRPC
jgi:hypothetical protein